MWESTRVADGDLAPLLQLQHLRDLRLMNRKHYRPSVAQVKEKLGMTDGG
jgi:internalin A